MRDSRIKWEVRIIMPKFVVLTIAIFLTVAIQAGPVSGFRAENENTQVEQLLSKVRTALGGEARLNSVQSLSASGKLRRVIRDESRSGDLSLDILLPGKFRKTEVISLLDGIDVSTTSVLNGDQSWRRVNTTSNIAQVNTSPDAKTVQAQNALLLEMRAELARHVLAWLLVAPPSFPVEFSYVGEAVAEDGQAEVLDLKGPQGFSLRLFLDKKTHRPLMVSYKGAARKIQFSDGPPPSNSKGPAPQQEAEIKLFLSDYRPVDGILLPHRITKSVNDETVEEWEISKFRVNPEIKPDKFDNK